LEQDATLGSTRQLLGALERFGLVEVLHQNFYYFLKKMSFFSFFFFFFFFSITKVSNVGFWEAPRAIRMLRPAAEWENVAARTGIV